MARSCENCGKGIMRGSKVARARQELLYRSPKKYKPNLQTARVRQSDGTRLKKLLCVKCLRMFKQQAAMQISSQGGVVSK